MKAYLHPKDIHRTLADAHDGCLKHFVIPATDVEQAVERAAHGIYQGRKRRNPGLGELNLRWEHLGPKAQANYRADARAALKAGGLIS